MVNILYNNIPTLSYTYICIGIRIIVYIYIYLINYWPGNKPQFVRLMAQFCKIIDLVFWSVFRWNFEFESQEIKKGLIFLLRRCKFMYESFKNIFKIRRDAHTHDDVIEWKHFLRYLPFVWGIHRSPVNSPHNGQWRGALMFPDLRLK